MESVSATRKDASTCTTSCGTITEPDLLGPCEPGSKVVLEGVVWLETPGNYRFMHTYLKLSNLYLEVLDA